MNISKRLLCFVLACALTAGIFSVYIPVSMTLDAVAQQLSATPFAEDELPEYGLSDASNVGVDKEKFETENLYTQPQADHVLNLSEYGAVADDQKDDTKAFEDAVAAAAELEGVKKIVLPAGRLDFVEGKNSIDPFFAIVIKNIDDLIIEGQETEWMLHGLFKVLNVVDCDNFFLTGISIDYARPTNSTAKVLACDVQKKEVLLQVFDNYPVDEYTEIKAYVEYDRITRNLRPNGNFKYKQNTSNDFEKVEYLGNQMLKITFATSITAAPTNTLVALSHNTRGYDAIDILRCDDLIFQNINLYNSPSMGIRGYTCNDLYFNRVNIMIKPGSDRLMTTGADGLHFIDCAGDLKITNSIIENNHDDALNVHGHYMNVKAVNAAAKQLTLNKKNYDYPPQAGDTIEVYDSLLELVAVLTVKTVEYQVDQNQHLVTVEEEIPSQVAAGMSVANATRTPRLLFENNIVRNKRNRGLLVQTRDSIIRNNTFSSIGSSSVSLLTMFINTIESLPVKNVVIENNKMVGNNVTGNAPGDISIMAYATNGAEPNEDTFENITVRNNFIANSQGAAINMRSTQKSEISDNLIYNVAINPKGDANNCSVYLSAVKDLLISGNYAKNDGVNEDYASIRLSPTVVEEDSITVEGNTNLGIGEGAVEQPPCFEVEKTNAKISVDGDLSEWAQTGTDLEIVGVSDVEQNEIVKESDDFKVNLMKMTYTEEGLYWAIDVTDDELFFAKSSPWTGDCVEIYLSSELKSLKDLSFSKDSNDSSAQLYMLPTTYSGNDIGGSFVAEARTSEEFYALRNDVSKMQFIFLVKSDGSGYTAEGFISFAAIPDIKALIDGGSEFSFVINVVDADPVKNILRVQSATVKHPVEQNKKIPAGMSKIKLV